MIFLSHRETKTQRFFEMKKLKRWQFVTSSFLIFLSPCLCVSVVDCQEIQQTPSVLLPEKYLENVRAPLKVGEVGPNFSLPRCAYDGSTPGTAMELSKWRDGKNKSGAIIVFWAFWCDTWKEVTRDLNVMQTPLSEMNLQILAVAVDASQQPVARRAFQEKKIWWPVAIDKKSQTSAAWGVRRVPTIFILDKEGKIQKVFEGFPGKQTFLRETAKALKLKVPVSRKKEK